MRHYLIALALALANATPAAAAWREARSNHFIIYSEQSEKELREFATKLERFDAAMRKVRGVPDIPPGPATRVTVYVVGNQAEVRKLFGAKDRWIAGFYMPRASGSIAITPQRMGNGSEWDLDAEKILFHEYGHHFLYQNYSGAYPAWFIEGYAEFHSTATFEKDGSVGLGIPAHHRAYGLLTSNPLPIERLLESHGSELNIDEREALYGRGWLLTHFLTFERERKGQFAHYLRLIGEGQTSLDAARSAFGDLKKLKKELDAYLQQRRMQYLKVPSGEIGPVEIRTLGRGADSIMELKIRSRRGVTREQALELLPEMRRLAEPFPDDPFVQATLAEAEYDAGNYAEATAAADRAIATAPRTIDALIYKAMAAMAVAGDSDDEKSWENARSLIRAANRVDPSHPTPLILYYDSFRLQGVKPTANAAVGLASAYGHAPHDRDLRVKAAYQFLVDGKEKEARAALAPIAFDPHAGGMGTFAAAVIDRIDSADAAAALRHWDEAMKAAQTGATAGSDAGQAGK